MIRVDQLTKAYERRVAVDGLSFAVERGEVLGLLGPNGAGKTTTLRALAGILPPTRGTVAIDGHDVVREPLAAKSRLALIADDPHLFGSLTVWEHLEFTAQVYGVRDFGAKGRALLERFDLADRAETVADELSRGMRQKVMTVCALLHDPVALLLDEPMTGLDPRGIRTLYAVLRERAAAGAAVIVSSHLLAQLESLCTRYLILVEGKRLFFGSRDEIRSQLEGLGGDATLEDIFFHATEGGGPANGAAPVNPGLVYLLRKGPRRKLRFLARRTSGTRRRILTVVGGVLLLAIVAVQVAQFFSPLRGHVVAAAEPAMRLFGPLVLVVLALLGIMVGYGLHFRPAEIDFLFPAPVSRRELLLYNVAARLGVALPSALWVGLFMAHQAPWPWAGFLGLYLMIVFLQFVSKLSVLIFSALSVQVRTRSPYLAPIAILIGIAFAMLLAQERVTDEATLRDTIVALSRTPLVRVLTLPTGVFIEVFLAHDVLELARWMLAALGILGAMLAAMVALDVSFLEGAVRVNQELEARMRRMRAGGGVYAASAPARSRLRLPRPARLGGVGPIAWRQAIEALRNARGLASAIAVMVGVAVLPVLLVRRNPELAGTTAGKITIGLALLATLNVSQQIPFDFRRDLDRMALLKTLPIAPAAVALGQLIPTVAIFSTVHLFVLILVSLLSGLMEPRWIAAIGVALLPLNWVHIALDNALFLLMPHRFEVKETGGFRMLDRLGVMLVKAPLLSLAAGLAIGAGMLAYVATGESAVAAGVAGSLALVAVAVPLTWWLGRLFARFDIPRDTPE